MKSTILKNMIVSLLLLPSLFGCTSISKGITEALIGSKEKDDIDTRQCFVRGRPFEGLLYSDSEQENGGAIPILKVLMVHGIGSHKPGYGTRLAENLANALKLPMVQENYKEFQLSSPRLPGMDLGTLRVNRFLSEDMKREMQFFELTWDTIVEAEKKTIAFDNSGEYSFRRAGFNEKLKLFVNDTVPDVVMYYGTFRVPIQASVSQSICWMTSARWEILPDGDEEYCDVSDPQALGEIQNDFVFITHSLGSRITSDALQYLATMAGENPALAERIRQLRDKKIKIFMLSNQLPLLQLGREKPKVTGQIDEICMPGSARGGERMFKETRIVAFSDPNDLFSYTIPPNFLRDHVDSRLCPTLTNVTLNISQVKDIFGLGELANPLAAHTGYDNDRRVIDLISNGIGTEQTTPLIKERCVWTETIAEKF